MTNREAWLTAATEAISAQLKELGHEVPKVHVSVGWPHGGRANTIGQCWPGRTSSDGIGHIFISPVMNDPAQVLHVLAHELVHSINHANGETGHGKEFAAIAKPLGLTGKMTSTVPTEEYAAVLAEVAATLGDYPHGALTPGSVEKNGPSRSGKSIKLECAAGEDFVVSISKSRLEQFGTPICPCHKESMVSA